MPSYEEVVLSLEADGFTGVLDTAFQLRAPIHPTECSLCHQLLEGPSIFFRTVGEVWRDQHLCLDRPACRARAAAYEYEQNAADTGQAARDALAAAVILPDEERFPENGD